MSFNGTSWSTACRHFSTLSAGHLKTWWDGHRQGPRQTKNAWLGDQKSSSHRHGKWEMNRNDMKWFKPKNITDYLAQIHRNPTKFCIFPGNSGSLSPSPAVRWCSPKFSAPRPVVWFGMVWICLNRAVDELLMFFVVYFFIYLVI